MTRRGIVIDPAVVVVGGLVALLGVGLVTALLWITPAAAARESVAACRGIGGFNPPARDLCPGGKPCSLPQPAPEWTATDHRGQPVKLSDFRGKVVLLNFWASWCGVCKLEKPQLAAMADELQGDDFEVISLASDHDWEGVRGALPNGAPFKVFLDPPADDGNIGAIASRWGIKAVPESALIDRQGNIRAYFVNKRDWESPVAQTCLRAVIDEE